LKNWISTCGTLKLGHYFSLCTKDLNVRPKSLKLQEENLRETFQDQGIDIDFLNMNPVAQEKQVTASIDKMELHQIRKLLHSKVNNF
jgi:hypothetical protein